MIWLIPTVLIACIFTFFLGYHYRVLTKKVEHLEQVVQSKVSKPVISDEPKSTIIDPTDEVAEAIYVHEQLMKKMNPE